MLQSQKSVTYVNSSNNDEKISPAQIPQKGEIFLSKFTVI